MNTACGSIQKWKVGEVVREILLLDEDIKGMVGQDIYPIIAPEGTLGAFILYRRDKYSKNYTKTCVNSEECTLIVTAVADDYDTAIELAMLIDNALTGNHMTDDNKRFDMRLADSSEDFVDKKYVETLLFDIR
jgi:hypothetical protein